MQFARRKLGTVYTKSPAQHVHYWFVTNLTKISFAILYGLIWMVCYYLIVSVIKFLGVYFTRDQGVELMRDLEKASAWYKMSAWDLYWTPKFLWANMIGFVCVVVYCLRDSLTKR